MGKKMPATVRGLSRRQERRVSDDLQIIRRLNMAFRNNIQEAPTFAFGPPAIPGLGAAAASTASISLEIITPNLIKILVSNSFYPSFHHSMIPLFR
jgi:hypothetical protein